MRARRTAGLHSPANLLRAVIVIWMVGGGALAQDEPVPPPEPPGGSGPEASPPPAGGGRGAAEHIGTGPGAPTGARHDTGAGAAAAAGAVGGSTDEDTAVTEALREWQDRPADPDALTKLVERLVARERADEALQWVVEFARLGGDVQTAEQWIATLDPLLAERRELLAATADRWLELADLCTDKTLYLNALTLADGAAALGAAERGAARREALLGKSKSLQRIARYGLSAQAVLHPSDPVPVWNPTVGPTRSMGNASGTGTASSSGGASPTGTARTSAATGATVHTARSRHYTVRTELGEDVARSALAVLDAAHAHFAEELDDDRTRGNVEVEIVPSLGALTLRRQAADPPVAPWALAWHDVADHRIVALDPRVVGEPLEVLWGRLASEACRPFLATLAIPAPTWLADGLATDAEGVRLLADGTVDTARPPWHRLDEVILSVKGRGTLRPHLDDLLRGDGHGAQDRAWAWALVEYLREARDASGAPLWADRFEQLLDDYRHEAELDPLQDALQPFDRALPDPLAWFVRRVIEGDGARDGIDNLLVFEDRWLSWIKQHAAVALGQLAAVDAELDAVRRLADEGRAEDAVRRLGRVLEGNPEHATAHALLVELHDRRHERDAAVLAARQLAAVLTPRTALGDDAVPERAHLDDERFATLARLDARIAAELRADDSAWRAGLARLVAAYRERGMPRAALRIVDRFLAVAPLDAELLGWRDALIEEIGRAQLLLEKRVPIAQPSSAFHGDRALWVADGQVLEVRAHDRALPAELTGMALLAAPYEIELAFSFGRPGGERPYDDGSNFAGLTLGAATPLGPGAWGLFVSPAGRIELAHQAHLEWSTERLGRTIPTNARLKLRVDDDGFEIVANNAALGRRPLGSRPPDGWLGLFVRRADATFTELIVRRDAGTQPPRRPWWARWEW